MEYKSDSFIKRTGTIENLFLDINKLPVFPESVTDEEFVITAEFDQRPDLLAYKIYGSTRLFWVFALRNLDIILDPIHDFQTGVTIMLPGKDIVDKYAAGI